jgi:hypothetical protein
MELIIGSPELMLGCGKLLLDWRSAECFTGKSNLIKEAPSISRKNPLADVLLCCRMSWRGSQSIRNKTVGSFSEKLSIRLSNFIKLG